MTSIVGTGVGDLSSVLDSEVWHGEDCAVGLTSVEQYINTQTAKG